MIGPTNPFRLVAKYRRYYTIHIASKYIISIIDSIIRYLSISLFLSFSFKFTYII